MTVGQGFFTFLQCSDRLRGLPRLPLNAPLGTDSFGVKEPQRELDHSFLTLFFMITYTSTPPHVSGVLQRKNIVTFHFCVSLHYYTEGMFRQVLLLPSVTCYKIYSETHSNILVTYKKLHIFMKKAVSV
jgi:hypothetical protein